MSRVIRLYDFYNYVYVLGCSGPSGERSATTSLGTMSWSRGSGNLQNGSSFRSESWLDDHEEMSCQQIAVGNNR